jgi:hypothetical protein
MYRFGKEGNVWKERGVGTVKLLKHKENGKVRLVMRQAKTLKICANHLGMPFSPVAVCRSFLSNSLRVHPELFIHRECGVRCRALLCSGVDHEDAGSRRQREVLRVARRRLC